MKDGKFEKGDIVTCIRLPEFGSWASDFLVVGHNYQVIEQRLYSGDKEVVYLDIPDHSNYLWLADCFELFNASQNKDLIQDKEFIKVLREHKRLLEI